MGTKNLDPDGVFVAISSNSTLATAQTAPNKSSVAVNFLDRTRVATWQWFAAPPQSETYGYAESLLRISVAQKISHFDWQLELAQPVRPLRLPATPSHPFQRKDSSDSEPPTTRPTATI